MAIEEDVVIHWCALKPARSQRDQRIRRKDPLVLSDDVEVTCEMKRKCPSRARLSPWLPPEEFRFTPVGGRRGHSRQGTHKHRNHGNRERNSRPHPRIRTLSLSKRQSYTPERNKLCQHLILERNMMSRRASQYDLCVPE